MDTTISLRDVQVEALDKVAEAVSAGQRRILGVAPTGFGKTIVFSHLAQYIAPHLPSAALNLVGGLRVLILVHRDELATQAVEKYQVCCPGTIIGIEKGVSHATPMDDVVVASVQSLKGPRMEAFIKTWGEPDLIITDEAHHAPAPSYQAIYNRFGVTPDGRIVHLGVTATARRGDNIGLDGTFDLIAFSYNLADIIERGYLVPLAGYRVETTTDLDKVRTMAGDFNERDLAATVNNPIRNARIVAAYRELAYGKKALFFGVDVEHSMNMRDAFEKAGFRAAHIDGSVNIEIRRQILKDFHEGKYDVLCNCMVLTEGYDEPTIECIILGRPTKSGSLYMQMIGRGTRLSEGKNRCIIIDIIDATRKHSVINIATLVGLPAVFDLKGGSATKAAKDYERMSKESPLAAMLIKDFTTLDALAKVEAEARLAFLVKELLEGAKRTQRYVSVDLLKAPPMPAEANGSTMAWVNVAEGRYMLSIADKGAESIVVREDTLGHYIVEKVNGGTTQLGTAPTLLSALQRSEAWIRANRQERVKLLESNTWRTGAASDKQINALKKFRIACPPGMTKGEASNALDIVMAAIAKGDHRN